MQGKSVFT